MPPTSRRDFVDSQRTHMQPEIIPNYHTTHRVDKGSRHGPQVQSQKGGSIDPVLLDAITKTVVEQLHLYSIPSPQESTSESAQPSSDAYKNSSRTPSQRQALDRFTRELQRYAENVHAAGRLPISTPTLSKSSATLRTVSALLPYQREFRAAGLAVTSQDQAQSAPQATARPFEHREYRRKIRKSMAYEVNGMDGKQDSSSFASTEVDFADPNTVDVWRRALIERMPSRRHAVVVETDGSSARGCIPCRSSKQVLRDKGKPPADVETAKKNVSMPIPAEVRQLKLTHAMPRSKATRGVRPEGYNLSQAQRQPIAAYDLDILEKAAAQDKPAQVNENLRLYPPTSTNIPSVPGKAQYRDVKPSPSPAAEPQGKAKSHKAPGGSNSTPPDLASQHAVKLGSNRLEQRQWQSLPLNQVRVSPAGSDVAEEVPWAALVPQANSNAKSRTEYNNVAPLDKTAMAKLEIAQHDYGPWPYPALDPKSRQGDSGLARRRPRIPSRKSSIRRIRPIYKADLDYSSVLDCDVLRGLCIATAAACDKATEQFLHEKTGVHIRRFLAELIQYDSLTRCPSGETTQERKRRRSQMRNLKSQARRSRVLE